MTRSVRCSGQELVFDVRRSRRRRTVALRVEPTGALTVYAPYFIWGPSLDRFVSRHSVWILNKQAYFQKHPELAAAQLKIPSSLKNWYRQRTLQLLTEPLRRYARLLGVEPRSVKIADAKSRWGSCSARGDLRFCWRLAALPVAVFEYIVLHELAHIQAHNHSKTFWGIVERFCPDYRIHRRWLRQNSRQISWS